MKIQCSCGAKYSLDVTPEMAKSPTRFVCSACGLDASEFVNNLIRQEVGVPVPETPIAPLAAAPLSVPLQPPAAPRLRVHRTTEPVAAEVVPEVTDAVQRCSRHPGELTNDQCFVCSKPICPKCMQLFGYVCSPLCKAKADSHGITVPVFEGQSSVAEARMWRRTVRVATSVVVITVAVLGVWIWYAWFGSHPKSAFSVRFPEPAFSGQSFFAGKDQIIFLHGDTLARHDMKLNREIWSRRLIDMKLIEAEVAKEIK